LIDRNNIVSHRNAGVDGLAAASAVILSTMKYWLLVSLDHETL
jgi:hypothetical protein